MNRFNRNLFRPVLCFLLVLCLAVSSAACTASAAENNQLLAAFTDIEGHWGREAIAYCLDRGYMKGVHSHTFQPNGLVTRVQVVQVLYNMAGSPETEGMESPFLDMEGHWGENAVVWAYGAGIIDEIGGQAFAPNAAVIREQVAVMFHCFYEYMEEEPAEADTEVLNPFFDRFLVSSWAREGVSWAIQTGVMSGTGSGQLSPKGTCTRAQLAQFIMNYWETEQPDEGEPPADNSPGDSDGPVILFDNSPLVSYTRRSPNHSGRRNHKIDTITIHCMAEDWTVEQCGAKFADANYEASSNYGIGSDGRIALYVDERNRSWCSSSEENDNRAVTIEVANIGGGPLWPVSHRAYAALIDLVTDICQRNGIKRLLWEGNPALIGQVNRQNMTVHRWFSAKSCPGEFLYSHHGEIASLVNRRLLGLDTVQGLEKAAELTADLPKEPKRWGFWLF